MNFKYTGLDKNYRKISGIIAAENEEEARSELHKMQLSVLTVESVSDEDAQKIEAEVKRKEEAAAAKEVPVGMEEEGKPKIITYYFKAIDTKGKEIDGTIDALDRFSAFKRLVSEYQFKILEVYDNSLSDSEKIKAREAGIADLEEKWEEETAKTGIASEEEGISTKYAEALEQESKNIQKAVDYLADKAKKFLEKYQNKLPVQKIGIIKKTLDDLLVIKMSNNFKHIRRLSQELVEYLDKYEKPFEEEKKEEITREERGKEKREEELYKQVLLTKEASAEISTVTRKVENLLQRFAAESKKRGFLVALIDFIKDMLAGKEEDPEIEDKKEEIQKYKKQLYTNIKAWFSEKDSEKKAKYKAAMAKNWENYSKSKQELRKIRYAEVKGFDLILKDVRTFLAGAIFFYTLYLFGAQFIVHKDIDLISTDFISGTMSSPLLLYIVLSLIIVYLLLTLKIRVFPKNIPAGLLISFLGVFSIVFMVANV